MKPVASMLRMLMTAVIYSPKNWRHSCYVGQASWARNSTFESVMAGWDAIRIFLIPSPSVSNERFQGAPF